MAKNSKLVEQLLALKELSGLTNVKIVEQSKNFVVPGTQRRHPLNDSSVGNWLRGENVPSEDGLKVLVGVMQRAAAERRPLIKPMDPELMKGVAEGRWLEWRAEVQRPVPTEDGSRWEEVVRTAKIWPDAADLRGQALAVLKRLEGERRKAVEAALADDPWLDEELAERTVRRTGELVECLSGDGEPVRFSAVEAFLLTVAPLLYHTRWAETAAEAHRRVDPTRLDRHPGREEEPDFELFLSGDQQHRLVERARRIPAEDDPDRRAICWWLFHRWLDKSASGQAPAGRPQSPALESPQAEALDQHLTDLLQVFRLSPGKLKDWRLAADHAEEWPGGQRLRIRLVAVVLGLAHTMAVEPGALSSTLVEHLGIDHQVELADLRRTLRGSSWVRTRTALRLKAQCRHEAVYEVLTEHVTRMSEVLRTAREAAARETALAPLFALPERASDEDVGPAVKEDGRPEFVIPTTKFRLDETRVRELLMGEQLYRDRSLAIRELYQNALDACRYSQAWRRYLMVKNGGPRDWPWPGKIEFRQWEEHGRHFLSCRDNGVGMGEAELREVFSQAGIRFADRREFAVERARWAGKGVHIHPNSRFGIGVMSYFMLADRIEVTTRRMNPGGDSLPLVKVTIAGPGHLFRVDTLTGPDDDGRGDGTEVTLHLRDGASAPSCVATLRALLGIAEFETTATYGEEDTEYWHPFEFEPRRRHPARDDSIEAFGRLQPGAKSENGQVVWCEHGGALLVDGIYVRCENQRGVLTGEESTSDPRGAVINLTGPFSPKLSVDRMSVLQDVSEWAEILLKQATGELRRPDSLLEYRWALDVARKNPGIADIIAEAAIDEGLPAKIGPYDTTADVVGVIELDPRLANDRTPLSASLARDIVEAPPHILLWRLLALIGEVPEGAAGRPLLPALPSDHLLATLVRFAHPDGASRAEVSPPSAWLVASYLGITPVTVIRRLAELGFSVADCEQLPPPTHLDSADLELLESAQQSPWSASMPDPHAQAVIASAQLDIPMVQVAQRLAELGLDSPHNVPPRRADGTDVRLISNFGRNSFDTSERFLAIDKTVSALYVLLAARATGLEPADAANRLRRLGLNVPDFDVTMADLEELPDPLRNAAEKVNKYGQRPRAGDIFNEALKQGCEPGELVRTLARFGVHADKQVPERLTETEEVLIQLLPSWPARIELREFLGAAMNVDLTIQEVATRLKDLGFEVCETAHLKQILDSRDRAVLKGIVSRPHFDAVDLLEFAKQVARTGYPSAEVAQRLSALGFATEGFPDVKGVNMQLIPAGLPEPGTPGWDEVPPPMIFKHAEEVRVETTQIVTCLRDLGYSVREIQDISTQERALICRDNSSLREMLDPRAPITVSEVLRSAIRAALPVREAATRLTELGYHFDFPDLEEELQRLMQLVPRRR